MTKQFLGLEEVSNITGMSKQNIQMHIRSGTFPNPAVYVGTRSGWAFEQMLDYSKRRGIDLNQEKIDELVELNEELVLKDVPPFYLFGITEFANALGWTPAKIKVYLERDMLPTPMAKLGKRVAWNFKQISKYAKENGMELQDIPNVNLVEVVMGAEEYQVWTIAPTFAGKWVAIKEAIEMKEQPRKIKGQTITTRRSVKNAYETEFFATRNEAIKYLIQSAIENDLEHAVLPDFEKELMNAGGMVEVAYRYQPYKVLPYEKNARILGEVAKPEECKILALNERAKGSLHGVCVYDLKQGTLIGYGESEEVQPPLNPVIVLYWVDKDTKKLHDLTADWEQSLKEVYGIK